MPCYLLYWGGGLLTARAGLVVIDNDGNEKVQESEKEEYIPIFFKNFVKFKDDDEIVMDKNFTYNPQTHTLTLLKNLNYSFYESHPDINIKTPNNSNNEIKLYGAYLNNLNETEALFDVGVNSHLTLNTISEKSSLSSDYQVPVISLSNNASLDIVGDQVLVLSNYGTGITAKQMAKNTKVTLSNKIWLVLNNYLGIGTSMTGSSLNLTIKDDAFIQHQDYGQAIGAVHDSTVVANITDNACVESIVIDEETGAEREEYGEYNISGITAMEGGEIKVNIGGSADINIGVGICGVGLGAWGTDSKAEINIFDKANVNVRGKSYECIAIGAYFNASVDINIKGGATVAAKAYDKDKKNPAIGACEGEGIYRGPNSFARITISGSPKIIADARNSYPSRGAAGIGSGFGAESEINISGRPIINAIGTGKYDDIGGGEGATSQISVSGYPIINNVKPVVMSGSLEQNAYTYTGKEIKPLIKIKVKYTMLKNIIGYSTDHFHQYENNINIGTGTVTVNDRNLGFYSKSFKIEAPKIVSATLPKTTYVYTGKEIKPTLKLAAQFAPNETKTSIPNLKYTYKSNLNIGKATVSISLCGKVLASRNFNIIPATPKIRKVTSKKGVATITFSKIQGGVTAYKIYYKKASSKKWSVKIVKASAKNLKLKLSKKTKYNFKIMTYKKVSKVDYNSAISKVITKKIN